MLDMGIIKIEINLSELTQAVESFQKNRRQALESLGKEIREGVSRFFNQLLHTEMTLFLGKADQSLNKRNGYYEREYALKGLGCLQIRMPRDRKNRFKSEIIPVHEQIDFRIKEDLALLHLAGISTRMIGMISRKLIGVEVSSDTVTKSLGLIEENALNWLNRPISEEYWALFVDGTNFRMQRRGSTEKEPSLVVLGLNLKNQFSILAIEPGQKDSASCWESLFEDLKHRGLKSDKVRLGVMDGLSGLENIFKESFSNAQTARCWVHAKRNAISKCPARFLESFNVFVEQIMYASSENAARVAFKQLQEVLGSDAQRAVSCLEKDLESLLVHYQFDRKLWRTLKTTNPIERVNKELKRRTKSMETLGERTLRVVTAFVALRLEYYWQQFPADSERVKYLKPFQRRELESVMGTMIH
jgi:putative transposase